jgi:hypothetical protein
MKTRCTLAESSKEGDGSKKVVLPVMMSNGNIFRKIMVNTVMAQMRNVSFLKNGVTNYDSILIICRGIFG